MTITRCENGHFYDQDKYARCPHCASADSFAGKVTTVSMDPDKLSSVHLSSGGSSSAGTSNRKDTAGHASEPAVTQPSQKRAPSVSAQPQAQPPEQAQPSASQTSAQALHSAPVSIHAAPALALDEAPDVFAGLEDNPEPEDNPVSYGKYAATPSEVKQAPIVRPLPPRPAQKPTDDPVTVGYYNQRLSIEPTVGWLVEIAGANVGSTYEIKTGINYLGRDKDENDVVITGDNSISRKKHAVVIYEPKAHTFLIQPGESKSLFYVNNSVVIKAEVLNSRDLIDIGRTRLLFVPLCGDDFTWDTYFDSEDYA